MERKCSNCGTWNTNEARCTNCGTALTAELQREERIQKEKKRIEVRPPDFVTAYGERLKNSKNPLLKGLYYIGFSVWFVIMSIVSFFLFMIAWGPG